MSATLPALAERVREAASEDRRAILEARVRSYGVVVHGDRVEVVGAIPVPPAAVPSGGACVSRAAALS